MKIETIEQCKGKKILITGGAGFIGSEIVRQITNSGGKAVIYDNFSSGKRKYLKNIQNIEIIKGDIKNKKLLEKSIKKCEYVINLAALPFIPDSYNFPQQFFDVNTNGTLNVILASMKNKKMKNFVHISTSEVYGTAKKSPMDENHPTLPHSTYAVSKLAADRAVFTIHKEHNFPAVIIRPFNSFGPRITQPYIIPEIVSQFKKENKEIKLGNVESSRDFTFVRDTANGVIKALFTDKAIGETINLGSGKSYKIKEIVKIIGSILNKNYKIKADKERIRPFDVNKLECNNNKAKKILDWKITTSFREGLEETIQWVDENEVRFGTSFKGWTKNEIYRKKR
ncbi:NAD-dependent epimerase/dehydratase [Candidatus Nitrosopumilus koreensis AR1]|uniref:NAD-dependent epimerase/dehydratase n=1 Tax=Candidatus Nitrosopumilus koreensis AR1 TaxID=1229908 RepID=K0B4E7_9ARCH|nr:MULTISPECIES: GDP-mannose 4,6-dehydratase [Nitrosopumilus]AFS80002.1 NAD-dependent epimerase/dehydratase [Candidatus Nitrosopumilus koreensis AR1]